MAIKHKLARLLPLLLLTGWMVKVSVKAQENGGDDDDPSQDNAISGWAYRTPKAQEPPSNVSDASFPFILIDPDIIQENKKHIYDYDRGLQHALWFLKKKADRYVANTTRLTVINKQVDVPGNDKHDYMSLARYFWPNDSSPNGLPYIRKDGHVNPESKEVADYAMLHAFVKSIENIFSKTIYSLKKAKNRSSKSSFWHSHTITLTIRRTLTRPSSVSIIGLLTPRPA